MTKDELQKIANAVKQEQASFEWHLNVCMGTGCLSQHSDRLRDELIKEVSASGKSCYVRRTGCMGLCAAGPLVLVEHTAHRTATSMGNAVRDQQTAIV